MSQIRLFVDRGTDFSVSYVRPDKKFHTQLHTLIPTIDLSRKCFGHDHYARFSFCPEKCERKEVNASSQLSWKIMLKPRPSFIRPIITSEKRDFSFHAIGGDARNIFPHEKNARKCEEIILFRLTEKD